MEGYTVNTDFLSLFGSLYTHFVFPRGDHCYQFPLNPSRNTLCRQRFKPQVLSQPHSLNLWDTIPECCFLPKPFHRHCLCNEIPFPQLKTKRADSPVCEVQLGYCVCTLLPNNCLQSLNCCSGGSA